MRFRQYVLIGIFFGLAVVYMLSTPAWEASDEVLHFAVVDHIAETKTLPVQNPDEATAWRQEGSQPPLYYMLSAALVSPIDRSYPPQVANPHAKTGIALATDNQNMLLHNTEAESFPWEGAILAVYVIRMFSILLACGTVWLTGELARMIVPQHGIVALIAMILTAFNPMFLFISASVNNDNLVIFLSTAIMVLLMYLYRFGWQWRMIILLMILLGLSALSKLSGLMFVPVAGLTLLIVQQRANRPWQDLVVATAMGIAVILVIAGWWYYRNWELYGDITGLNRMVDIAGHRPDSFRLPDLWSEREGFYYAYWGWFGGLNILSNQSFFTLSLIITGASLAGLLLTLFAAQSRPWRLPLLILLLQVFLVFSGVVRWTSMTYASQGRLLFPAIGAISLLLAIGLWKLGYQSRLLRIGVITSLVALTVYATMIPFITIMPAYAVSESLEKLPDNVQPVDAVFDGIKLIGYHIDETPVQGDGMVDISLYWQPLYQTEDPLSLFVQVFAPDAKGNPVIVGKLDTYPAGGMRQTDTWEIGQIYEDRYLIELDGTSDFVPFEPRFKLGWRNNETDTLINPVNSAGEAFDSVIVRGGTVYENCHVTSGALNVRWPDLAQLDEVQVEATTIRAGDTLPVTLHWTTLDTTPDSYTVFLHLVGDHPTPVFGNGDRVPRMDWYPTTAWVADTCFQETYQLVVSPETPPGTHNILVGFYRADTGQRVPVASDGVSATGYSDAYHLPFTVTVTAASPE